MKERQGQMGVALGVARAARAAAKLGLLGAVLPLDELRRLRCERWRDYRVDLTQDEIEAHPAQRAFGSQADHHPPLPDWLATPVCSEDGRPYGLLQPSGKAGGADFTEEDADNIRDLAAFAGATLDALRAARGAARSHF